MAAATAGAATSDRDEKVRAEARALAKLLFAKLDALSHFHYAPKPVLEELSVRADVPALAMEEVAPQVTRHIALLTYAIASAVLCFAFCVVCASVLDRTGASCCM